MFNKTAKTLILTIAAWGLVSACAHSKDQHHRDRMAARVNEKVPVMLVETSRQSFEETLMDLKSAIDAKGLKTFAVIDHSAGAASIDQTLTPSTLVIFGAPKAGTPLMQANIEAGYSLPMRALVFEENGEVKVGVTNTVRLSMLHGLADEQDVLDRISNVLSSVQTAAISAE